VLSVLQPLVALLVPRVLSSLRLVKLLAPIVLLVWRVSLVLLLVTLKEILALTVIRELGLLLVLRIAPIASPVNTVRLPPQELLRRLLALLAVLPSFHLLVPLHALIADPDGRMMTQLLLRRGPREMLPATLALYTSMDLM
jgi:hypothetical protein